MLGATKGEGYRALIRSQKVADLSDIFSRLLEPEWGGEGEIM